MNANAAPSYEDMLEAFIDAAASAGLEPVDEYAAQPRVRATLEHFHADAFRSNGDSITLARLVAGDERIDLKVTTPSGVIIIELSFPVSRLGLRMFGECAAVAP